MRYFIAPVPKPRMTRRDRWKRRPCVVRYWAFRDQVRALGLQVTEFDAVIFHLPMPTSWSATKREEMAGAPHWQRPDLDNLVKALLDAIYAEDAHISRINAEKRWAEVGAIEIVPVVAGRPELS